MHETPGHRILLDDKRRPPGAWPRGVFSVIDEAISAVSLFVGNDYFVMANKQWNLINQAHE
jgi:hypothetical protein